MKNTNHTTIKKTITKTITLFLMLIFIASSATAESGTVGPSNSPESNTPSVTVGTTLPEVAATENAITEIVRSIPEATDKETAITTCIEKAKAQFPRVKEPRLELACKTLVYKRLPTEKKAELRENVKMRIQERYSSLTPEQKERLQNVVKNRPAASDVLTSLNAENAEKFSLLSRARQDSVLNMDEGERTTYLARLAIKKRAIAQAMDPVAKEQLRQKYENAKERYQEAKTTYTETRRGFIDAVRAEQECANQDTLECDVIREESISTVKEHLYSLADTIIASLDKVKAKVEESEIDEAEKIKHIQELDNTITDVNDARDAVDAATTKAEVKTAGRTLIDTWKRIQVRLRQATVSVLNTDIKGILAQSERLEARLNAVLAKMEEQGLDTTDIQDHVDKFSTYVTNAKDKYEKARALYTQAQTSAADAKKNIEEANVLLRSAHEDLKAASLILRDIIKLINQAGGSIDDATEDAYEVVPTESPTLPDEEIWTESDLATIDARQCWGDKPDYTPGTGAGYYIWQGTCAHFWWIDWTGSAGRGATSAAVTTESDEGWHTMGGTITTNGRFIDSGVRKYEQFDTFQVRHNTITFKSRVGPSFDGLYFRTTGDTVTFDIMIDGEKQPEKVYVGKALKKPDAIPFSLKGTPSKARSICAHSEIAYQGRCVTGIDGKDLDVSTDPGEKILEYDAVEAVPATTDGTVTIVSQS